MGGSVDLLHRRGRRQEGLRLASQVITELEARQIPGAAAGQWRLLLAFHAGKPAAPPWPSGYSPQ